MAVLGLVVNLASVKLLHIGHAHHDHAPASEDHHREHQAEDDHDHDHDQNGDDHNLRAAYLHVLADAFTSVLAILALLGGCYLGWAFLDPAMGVIGGIVIARWSFGLSRSAARQLLDVAPSTDLAARIRRRLEATPGTQVVDLHVWEIGPRARACIASLVARDARSPLDDADELRRHEALAHVTIEVHAGRGSSSLA